MHKIWKFCFLNEIYSHLIFGKIIKFVATRCLRRLGPDAEIRWSPIFILIGAAVHTTPKCVSSQGSAPDPAGELTMLP